MPATFRSGGYSVLVAVGALVVSVDGASFRNCDIGQIRLAAPTTDPGSQT